MQFALAVLAAPPWRWPVLWLLTTRRQSRKPLTRASGIPITTLTPREILRLLCKARG